MNDGFSQNFACIAMAPNEQPTSFVLEIPNSANPVFSNVTITPEQRAKMELDSKVQGLRYQEVKRMKNDIRQLCKKWRESVEVVGNVDLNTLFQSFVIIDQTHQKNLETIFNENPGSYWSQGVKVTKDKTQLYREFFYQMRTSIDELDE